MTRRMLALATLGALLLTAAPALAKKTGRTIVIKASSRLAQHGLSTTLPVACRPATGSSSPSGSLIAAASASGSDAASCVRPFDETSLCTGVYRLPGGRLMVQLLQPGPTGTYDQAITGRVGANPPAIAEENTVLQFSS